LQKKFNVIKEEVINLEYGLLEICLLEMVLSKKTWPPWPLGWVWDVWGGGGGWL